MKTAISDLVIRVGIANQLQSAGIHAPSIFVYTQDEDGPPTPALRENGQPGLAAYLSGELISLLPGLLHVNNHTYRASRKGWVKLRSRNLNYPFSHLNVTRVFESYSAGYFHQGKMIAFGRNPDGKYRNLLYTGETEQEALANLLLALLWEGKYNNHNKTIIEEISL